MTKTEHGAKEINMSEYARMIEERQRNAVCLHLVTYVDDDNFWRCGTCGEITD